MKKAALGLLFLLAFETAMHALSLKRFRAKLHNEHALIRAFLRVTCG
jgi:hypothetical protein